MRQTPFWPNHYKWALGDEHDVRYPQMPYESKPDMQTWKTKITRELEALDGRVMLVGHSMVVPRVCSCSLCRRGMKKTGISTISNTARSGSEVIVHTPNLSLSQPRRRDCTVQTSRVTCYQTTSRHSARREQGWPSIRKRFGERCE